MCEVPPRSFRRAIKPERVLLAVISIAAIATGFVLIKEIAGLIVLGLGIAALFAVVLFPAIRDVEFGFPSGIRVRTALRDREQELARAFTAQKGDFTLYAQLLCGEPETATLLLEAAWAKTASEWRGPVTPYLRTYVLCVFVHLLESHAKWAAGTPAAQALATPPDYDPLASLTLSERTVVVLHEFAELPLAQVASITERPLADVTADLHAAQSTLATRRGEGDAS